MPAVKKLRPAARLIALIAFLFALSHATAATVTVAVAANFQTAAEEIAEAFEASTGHEVRLVFGSTGQLFAQISRFAPFDVFLAADAERPRRLVDAELADESSRFTYALGRLVIWSRRIELVESLGLDAVHEQSVRHIVMANPELAPYGRAARETLEHMGAWEELEPRIAYGQSVGQAFALAATQTADLGFVAYSQALAFDDEAAYRLIPADYHSPIEQDAVLLIRSAANPAAIDFMQFMRSERATEIIEALGYDAGS